MAAFIATGLLAPMSVEAAAIKGKIKVAYWTSATSCDLEINQQNADKYQYRIYFNSKRLKGTSSKISLPDYGDPYHSLAIKNLPKNSCSYISVRIHKNGAWTSWSSKILLIPPYMSPGIKPTLKYNKTKKTCTVSWKKILGITNYDLYISTNATQWTKVKSFTKSSKTQYTFKKYKGKAFKDNTFYYFKIRARRKVNGRWVRSIPIKKSIASGHFGFNLIIRE